VNPPTGEARDHGTEAPAVEARGLSKRFGPLPALRALDLTLRAGKCLAVLGPNGAGKSTLLRLVAGLARPSAGSVEVAGTGRDRQARRRAVGLIGHTTFLYPALTARENLELAARLYDVAEPAARAEALIGEHGLEVVAERRAGALSRGWGQRVAIARARVHEPALLLLDEPFSGLDPRAADALAERLSLLSGSGRSAILVTHDLARASALADRILVLGRGLSREIQAPRSDVAALAASYRQAVAELEAAA